MPNHKLTLLGHPAFKAAQAYLLFYRHPRETTRVAFAHGVIAISGEKRPKRGGADLDQDRPKLDAGDFALRQYKVDIHSEEVVRRFTAMISKYNVKRAENWDIDNCAESHLWMTLIALHSRYALAGQSPRHLHPHPKELHLWVYEIDRKNRPKEDSPCHTCRQWVRREFLTVNGTD
jgi:hypothetical protein